MSLSTKQIDFLNRPFDRTLDVAEGTPRSGKTTACILRFYDFLNTSKDSNFLVVGASQQQAFRLVMDGDGNGLTHLFGRQAHLKHDDHGDHLEALMNHGAPGLVDLCLANSAPVQAGLVERYRAEDAVPLAVDRERVAAMGLELVERPVASEGGNFARHDPDKLAAAVLEIYRQRAVRIFRGKERYIIEE